MRATGAAPVLRAVIDPATWVAGLARAVGLALEALADPRHPHATVRDGQLEYVLRTASRGRPHLGAPTDADRAAAAVRVACAYLTAGDLRETYQALLTARNSLPSRDEPHRPPSTGTPSKAITTVTPI